MFRICMFFSPYLNIFFSPMREPCFVLYFLKNLYDRLLQKKSVNLWAFDSGAIVHPQHPHQEHRPHPQYRPRGPLRHAASPCYPSHVGTCFLFLQIHNVVLQTCQESAALKDAGSQSQAILAQSDLYRLCICLSVRINCVCMYVCMADMLSLEHFFLNVL